MDDIQKRKYSNSNLLKATDVAEILNISIAFAYKLMQTGEIRTVWLGSLRRMFSDDLDEYIQNNKQPQLIPKGVK